MRTTRSTRVVVAAMLVSIVAPSAACTTRRAGAPRRDCVTAGRMALRGIVRREIQLGAPGYGENPATDRRDTIAVLILPAPLTLCPDSAVHGAQEPPVRTRRVALRTVPRAVLTMQGASVTVFGRVGEASFAWEYGPLVMWVDSVPALRTPPGAKTT